MAGELHGIAIWPGAIAVEGCTYTISHGISPGTAILRMSPQPVFPDMQGDLVITDGNESVTIPGCKVDDLKVEQDSNGVYWSLTIVDTRWRWRDLGAITGCYNQLDPHAKLYPWGIQSPTELAILCLNALGVTSYTLNLPPGIDNPGPNVAQPIVNVSGTNPPVNWNYLPPAQALQQLAEMYGCRVIYQLYNDSILVTPLGIGADLPPGSIHKQGPSIKDPETPDSIGVVGAPTRFQMRLALDAVGEDFDGDYRPIDFLSYAPTLQLPKPQISTVTVTYDGVTLGTPLTYLISVNQVVFQYNVVALDTQNTIANSLDLRILASQDPRIAGVISSAIVNNVLTLTGPAGVSFNVLAGLAGLPIFPAFRWPKGNDCQAATIQSATNPDSRWFDSGPNGSGNHEFGNLNAPTDRLTRLQAEALAQKTVWKYYRIVNVDVSFDGGTINVPGYGRLQRRQQVILQDTQVDQITPQPGDANIVDIDGQPYNVNFYNGYSKDKPAAIYGSVCASVFSGDNPFVYAEEPFTPDGSQLLIPFSIDPIQQLVIFSSPVYSTTPDALNYIVPRLSLQTAVLIRNADTNQIEAFTQIVPLPGQNSTTMPKMEHHPDIQLEITSVYGANGQIQAVDILDDDALNRASYYLAGLAAQYNTSAAQTLEYNGIKAIQLDGAIQQVTWTVGEGGASTVASRNTEHHLYVPPYAARRRAEFLPALAAPKRMDAPALVVKPPEPPT
jgi:hypothetical protein